MIEKIWNKNVRFNTNNDVAVQAWDILHSDEVEKKVLSNLPALLGLYVMKNEYKGKEV